MKSNRSDQWRPRDYFLASATKKSRATAMKKHTNGDAHVGALFQVDNRQLCNSFENDPTGWKRQNRNRASPFPKVRQFWLQNTTKDHKTSSVFLLCQAGMALSLNMLLLSSGLALFPSLSLLWAVFIFAVLSAATFESTQYYNLPWQYCLALNHF